MTAQAAYHQAAHLAMQELKTELDRWGGGGLYLTLFLLFPYASVGTARIVSNFSLSFRIQLFFISLCNNNEKFGSGMLRN